MKSKSEPNLGPCRMSQGVRSLVGWRMSQSAKNNKKNLLLWCWRSGRTLRPTLISCFQGIPWIYGTNGCRGTLFVASELLQPQINTGFVQVSDHNIGGTLPSGSYSISVCGLVLILDFSSLAGKRSYLDQRELGGSIELHETPQV